MSILRNAQFWKAQFSLIRQNSYFFISSIQGPICIETLEKKWKKFLGGVLKYTQNTKFQAKIWLFFKNDGSRGESIEILVPPFFQALFSHLFRQLNFQNPTTGPKVMTCTLPEGHMTHFDP